MGICCNNPYNLCDLAYGCFSQLAFRVPPTYEAETITLRFGKNINGSIVFFNYTGPIVDGWVIIDPEACPDGFFNAYGGSYQAEFIDESQQQYPFVAKDGMAYDEFTFAFGINAGEPIVSVINIIDNTPYSN